MNADHDFESALRDDLTRIGGAVRPDHGLADRLIANASSGTRTVVPLRRSRRFAAPLLAAAVCVVLVVGIVVANRFNVGRQAPAVAPVVTTGVDTAARTTDGRTTAAATGAVPTNGAPTTTGAPATEPRATEAPLIAPAESSPMGEVSGSVEMKPPGPPVKFDWWQVLPAATGAPKGFTASYTRFLNADTGFVLGDTPCSGQSQRCLTLIRTDDGGASWRSLAVPQELRTFSFDWGCRIENMDALPCVNDVIFDDADHGYLWGQDHAYATSDGGRSWKLVPSPRPNDDYTFVGDRVLRVVADSSDQPFVYGVQSAPAGSTDFQPVTDAQFSDSTRFVIYQGGPITYLLAYKPQGERKVFRTRDAQVWEPVPTPCDSRQEYLPLYPAPDGSIFADCGTTFTGSEVDLLTTASSAWTRIPSPRFDGFEGGSLVTATSADRFALLVSIKGQGDLLSWIATDDGGSTWSEPRNVGAAFPTIDFRNSVASRGGFAYVTYGSTSLVSSPDGGKTWQQRAFG